MRRLIIGMTGSTGAIYGVRFLEALKHAGDVESHLIISKWAQRTIEHETNYTVEQVRGARRRRALARRHGRDAVVRLVPHRRHGGDPVLGAHARRHRPGRRRSSRAPRRRRGAEGARKLVLVVRETPLSEVHLENMLKLSRMGVTMLPPMPAFYNHPQSIDELVNHTVGRVLDQFGIPAPFEKRWDGHMHTAAKIVPVPPAGRHQKRDVIHSAITSYTSSGCSRATFHSARASARCADARRAAASASRAALMISLRAVTWERVGRVPSVFCRAGRAR